MIRLSVRGLDGFMADVDVAEERLVDGMRDLASEIARDIAKEARNKAERGKRSGDAAGSIRSQGPVVSAGTGVVYYGFADFGGKVGAGRRISRPYIKGGRYLYPAVRELGAAKRVERMVDETTGNLR